MTRLIFLISLLVVFATSVAADSFVQKQARVQILKIFSDMQPSVLGASGTGQLLAREMPVIMNRLRETRYAIANVGTDYVTNGADNETTPFAFIEDAKDRRTLIRYIDDYTHLLNQLDVASAFDDDSQIAEVQVALRRKSQQIERLVGIWGRNIEDIGGDLGATQATTTKSEPVGTSSCKWQNTGIFGDFTGRDVLPLTKGTSIPSPANCNINFQRKTADCFDDKSAKHIHGGVFCTYKDVPTSSYAHGTNNGRVHECVCN